MTMSMTQADRSESGVHSRFQHSTASPDFSFWLPGLNPENKRPRWRDLAIVDLRLKGFLNLVQDFRFRNKMENTFVPDFPGSQRGSGIWTPPYELDAADL